MEQKEPFDKASEISKQEVSFVLKDGFMKQEPNFLQYIQHLQKDQNLIHTFSSFKEQAMKETNILQQQAVNMNEILPQNTRSWDELHHFSFYSIIFNTNKKPKVI